MKIRLYGGHDCIDYCILECIYSRVVGRSQKENKTKKKRKCIIRESNTGLIDGNDEFYH